MCLFGRMRVYLGGQLIEDVLNLNRHVGMMMKLLPANRNITQSIEGVGADGGTNGPTSDLIPASASRNILTPLHGSGFFASHYLIPVGSFGVTVELELCDPAFVAAYQNPTGTNRSQTYSIIQARLLADVVHVDSAIQNQISQALLEGKPLPIHFKTWNNTNYSIDSSGGSWSINISRGFSRLASVFVTFSNQAKTVLNTAGYTRSNFFGSWHSNAAYDFTRDTFSAQLAVGPLLFPDYPIGQLGHAECFYQLSKCLAMHSSLDGVSITPNLYRGDSFILALDLEKCATSPRQWPKCSVGHQQQRPRTTRCAAVRPRDLRHWLGPRHHVVGPPV